MAGSHKQVIFGPKVIESHITEFGASGQNTNTF